MKLCSACLLGINCRYDGKSKINEKIMNLAASECLIPICPEQLGGLATPRPAVEVKDGKAITKDGKNMTEYFENGAKEVLKIAKLLDVKEAILKQKSPSCGCGQMYGGSFSGKIIDGDGITTKLLNNNGISVISENEVN